MTKKFLLLAIALLTIDNSFSQKIIKGYVLEQRTKKPISYVNIGILNSNIGTTSNQDGTFLISIPSNYLTDTVIFSALGFISRNIPIPLLKESKSVVIYPPERETMLETITIRAKREKKREFKLGNRYSRGGLNMSSAEDATAGASVALLIQNNYPSYNKDLVYPVYIENARLRINDNTTGDFKIRVRFYQVDTLTGLPGKDMLNESVILKSNIKNGWLDFNLSTYNIQVQGAFFIAFEWIMEETERQSLKAEYRAFEKLHPELVKTDTTIIVDGKRISTRHYVNFLPGISFGVSLLSFSLSNYQCFSRYNSWGEWKRSAFILTTRVTVSNQPAGNNKGISLQDRSNGLNPCHEKTPLCETRKLCEDYLDEVPVNGMQLSVILNEKKVFSEGFGYADVENKTLVTAQTRFRIGSVSKALTSAALIKLEAEGKLNLDVPIQRYVPSFPQKKYSITTQQLAGHLTGIRHYNENEQSDLTRKEHYNSCVESISIFKDDTLAFKPEAQYKYSSYGWNLIGAVIECVAEQNYLHYMYNNIWKPLSMLHTYGDVTDSLMSDKSKFYYVTGEEAKPYDLSCKYPSGGLLSTTEDLVKFGNELLHGSYFDNTLKENLFKTQYTSDKKPTNYGLGWNIGKDKNGHRIWYHAGNLLEGSAYLIIYPDDDIVVAFLANSRDGLSFDIQKIGELYYKK